MTKYVCRVGRTLLKVIAMWLFCVAITVGAILNLVIDLFRKDV